MHQRPLETVTAPRTHAAVVAGARPVRLTRPSVAYQGAPGAYGEAAIADYWNGSATGVAVRSFAALVDVVADGGVEFGMVTIWNSIIGDVREACDALAAARDRVAQVGEWTLPVRHALLAVPGTTLQALRAVGSHRAALAQCGAFLARHPALRPIVAWDTAGAAQELAVLARGADGHAPRDGDALGRAVRPAPWHAEIPDADAASLGVIASEAVAHLHGLQVVARDIQGDTENVTRFAVVRMREVACRW